MFDSVFSRKQTKMNVLYTSQKLQELFSDKHDLPLHANASGDGDGIPGRCCRLCGGDSNLRYFEDTYVWEGVEERYDQLLYDCFGVKVTPPDCMICKWCVRALRNTERFRALVHAAFDHPVSDQSSSVSSTLKSSSCANTDAKSVTKPEEEEQPKKPLELAKRQENRKRVVANEAKTKRINIPCEVCKQRYPMLVPNNGSKTFICSRCKKNGEIKGSICRKCNIVMPAHMIKDHLELHAKADLRAKARVHQPKKNQLTFVNSVTKQRQKYQCSQCPKKYAVARNLALHVRNAHGDSLDNLCLVCGQDMETREKLEKHLAQHSGLQQCDECPIIFSNRKTLINHSLSHQIKSTAS